MTYGEVLEAVWSKYVGQLDPADFAYTHGLVRDYIETAYTGPDPELGIGTAQDLGLALALHIAMAARE